MEQWLLRGLETTQNLPRVSWALAFQITKPCQTDLFSLYVLFSHFRPRDATRRNSFFQMSSYARANARLCSKENFREPFGHPSVLASVPRPKRWSPKLKFRGALRAPKHFSWDARASKLEFFTFCNGKVRFSSV